MKRKIDFITNSSSTSFIVWGIRCDLSDIRDNEELMRKVYNSLKEHDLDITYDDFINESTTQLMEDFEEFLPLRETGLDISTGPDGYDFMIGGSPENMKLYQTLKEYQDQIISELRKIGIHVDSLNFIAETWRDG